MRAMGSRGSSFDAVRQESTGTLARHHPGRQEQGNQHNKPCRTKQLANAHINSRTF